MPLFWNIGFPLLFLVVSILVMLFFPRKTKEWIGEKPKKEHLIPTIFLFFQLLIVGIGIDWVATSLGINDTHIVKAVANELAQQPIRSTILLAFSGFSEELFFRGILYTLAGPIISIIGFGFFHLGYQSIVEFIGAILAGIILVRGREKYHSISPGMGGHILYNLFILFVLPL